MSEHLPPRRGEERLIPVWDKDGNRHVLDHLNAHDVVAHLGWSRTSPAAPVAVEAPATPAEEPTQAPVDAPVDAPAEPAASEGPVDLTTLDRAGLVAFGKEHFNLEFADDMSEEDIFDALLDKSTTPAD